MPARFRRMRSGNSLLVNIARHFKYLKPGEEPRAVPRWSSFGMPTSAFSPPRGENGGPLRGRRLGAFQWQARKLAELGQVNRENVEIIRRMLGDVPSELSDGLERAILDALSDIEAPLRQAAEEGLLGDITPPPEPDPKAMRAFTLYHGLRTAAHAIYCGSAAAPRASSGCQRGLVATRRRIYNTKSVGNAAPWRDCYQSLDGMNLVNSTMLESTAEAYRGPRVRVRPRG